jgi:hypothetical protein
MKDGVSVTPTGREIVQLRVTLSPATMEEEGEETRDMLAGSIVISSAMVDIIMMPKAVSADTLMLYVDPVIRPLIVALVTFPNSSVNTLCSPFCW